MFFRQSTPENQVVLGLRACVYDALVVLVLLGAHPHEEPLRRRLGQHGLEVEVGERLGGGGGTLGEVRRGGGAGRGDGGHGALPEVGGEEVVLAERPGECGEQGLGARRLC